MGKRPAARAPCPFAYGPFFLGKSASYAAAQHNTHTDPMTTSTPPKVALAATETDMPLPTGLALLGTLIAPQSSRALLRHGKRTRQVALGDRIHGHQIVSITEGKVILARKGTQKTLSLPQ